MYYKRGNLKGGVVVIVTFACFILWLHFSQARRLAKTKIRSAARLASMRAYMSKNKLKKNDIGHKGSEKSIRNIRGAVRLFGDDFLAAGATCTRAGPGTFPRCPPGYWCLGTDGSRVCARRENLGGSCSDDPFRCGPELKCVNGVCEDDLFLLGMYLEYGKPCGMNAYQRCKPGLWCIEGACRKLVPCGGECDDVRFVCRSGLECMNIAHKTVKVCRPAKGVTPETVLFGGQTCTPGGTRCKIGLMCTVKDGESTGTCMKPARLGQPCGGDLGLCEADRTCRNNVCIQVMLAGQYCDPSMSLICDDGLTCTANECV